MSEVAEPVHFFTSHWVPVNTTTVFLPASTPASSITGGGGDEDDGVRRLLAGLPADDRPDDSEEHEREQDELPVSARRNPLGGPHRGGRCFRSHLGKPGGCGCGNYVAAVEKPPPSIRDF